MLARMTKSFLVTQWKNDLTMSVSFQDIHFTSKEAKQKYKTKQTKQAMESA